MKRDKIVGGEAMAAVEGNEAIALLRSAMVIDMQKEPQQAAFNAYRAALRANEANPTLKTAVSLVTAWNALADIMGLARA